MRWGVGGGEGIVKSHTVTSTGACRWAATSALFAVSPAVVSKSGALVSLNCQVTEQRTATPALKSGTLVSRNCQFTERRTAT